MPGSALHEEKLQWFENQLEDIPNLQILQLTLVDYVQSDSR